MNEARIKLISEKLAILAPTLLEIEDQSAAHVGHAGAATGLGHFKIKIDSPQFKEKTPLEIHRLIYNALGSLMQTDIHALSIELVS